MPDRSQDVYTPIYESANYRIDATGFQANKSVFVSFSERTAPTRRSGEHRFSKYRLDTVYVTTRGPHWYQYPDSADAARAVGEFCSRYDRVVTYGESMGGYGALMFSEIVDPEITIAFSPQYSVDTAKVPFETRWPDNRAKILAEGGFIFDNMKLGRKGRTIVLFDPRNADARHAELVRQGRSVETVIVPFSGHSVLRVLSEMKLLSTFLIEAATGEPDLPALRRQIRAARWNSTTYLLGAAKACKARGLDRLPPSWQGLPETMIRRAGEVDAASLRDLKKNRRIAMSAGNEEQAASELLRLLAVPMFYTRGQPLRVFRKSLPAILRHDLKARTLQVLENAVAADPSCDAIVQEMREALGKAPETILPGLPATEDHPVKSSSMGEWTGWFAWRPVKLLETKERIWMRRVMRRHVASIGGNPAFWQYTETPSRYPAKLSGAELIARWPEVDPRDAKMVPPN
jgi:hypothetical protein